jgi:predicted  nucleic acid-binding Zn-ribbon protein
MSATSAINPTAGNPPVATGSSTSGLPNWLGKAIAGLQIISIGTLIVIGRWVGSIETTVKDTSDKVTRLESAVLDVNSGLGVKVGKIETSVDDIKKRLESMQIKPVASNQAGTERGQADLGPAGGTSLKAQTDYETKINELAASVEALKKQVEQMSGRLSRADGQLAETESDLKSLTSSVREIGDRMPKEQRDALLGRIDEVQRKLEEARRLLRG